MYLLAKKNRAGQQFVVRVDFIQKLWQKGERSLRTGLNSKYSKDKWRFIAKKQAVELGNGNIRGF